MQQSLKRSLLGLLISALVLLSGGGGVLLWYGKQPLLAVTEQPFTIAQGDSLATVASRLAAQGVLASPTAFASMGQLLDQDDRLHVGDYRITPGTTHWQLLTAFTQGRVHYYDITLIEGQTFAQALAVLNSHPKLQQPLRQPATIQAFLRSVGIMGSPEGQFYPDTYHFIAGASVPSILRRAHQQVNQVLDEEWQHRAMGLPLASPYEALILASIIEKETGAAFERPAIAGVLIRRLQRNMRLQSDPTVIYGMGERYQGRLNQRLLKEKTPYNTYQINGLPPTPIALVGRAAMRAALNPAAGSSLYFVAKGDGTHHFSKTLAEHNRAVKKYQIHERKTDYRSTVAAPMVPTEQPAAGRRP